MGISLTHLQEESFTLSKTKNLNSGSTNKEHSLSIQLHGKQSSLKMLSSETLLDAARRKGLNPPKSCMEGVCGTCRAKLIEGTVHENTREGLSQSDIDSGCILTCQCFPNSDNLALSWDL